MDKKVFDFELLMDINKIYNLSELAYKADIPYKKLLLIYENKLDPVPKLYIKRLCAALGCKEESLYTNKTIEELEEIRFFSYRVNRQKPQGIIYFVRALCGEQEGLVKIGYTTNLKTRLLSLKGESGAEVELLHHIPTTDCLNMEKTLHNIFKSKRITGEWFDLSDEDIELIKP
ncbi:GIY-YIG nuclease family protein [Priestia flexa]|uniref:GIY-YIG nuclease family protein n=1 Tax=Priestia flexa TaxID=86664 RepID=UPI003D07D56F